MAALFGQLHPLITIPDMVRAQAMLVKRLGIDTLFSVVGGSMGGESRINSTSDASGGPSVRSTDGSLGRSSYCRMGYFARR